MRARGNHTSNCVTVLTRRHVLCSVDPKPVRSTIFPMFSTHSAARRVDISRAHRPSACDRESPNSTSRTTQLEIKLRSASSHDSFRAAVQLRVDSFGLVSPDSEDCSREAVVMEELETLKDHCKAPDPNEAATGQQRRVDCILATADPFHQLVSDMGPEYLTKDSDGDAMVVGTLDLAAILPAPSDTEAASSGTISSAAYMANLCVHPAARRQSVGLQLVEYAQGVAALWGAQMLWVEVKAGNRAAISLYKTCGFEIAGGDDVAAAADENEVLLMHDPSFRAAARWQKSWPIIPS